MDNDKLDTLALTEAAFVCLKREDFWDTVATDRTAAERQLQDAIDLYCVPDCSECPLPRMGLMCGLSGSPLCEAERAIDMYYVDRETLRREDDQGREDLSDYWRCWFADSCERIITALRAIRKEQDSK